MDTTMATEADSIAEDKKPEVASQVEVVAVGAGGSVGDGSQPGQLGSQQDSTACSLLDVSCTFSDSLSQDKHTAHPIKQGW